MIKKFILFCFLFTVASVSGADFMFKAGMNYSQFATEDGSSEIPSA